MTFPNPCFLYNHNCILIYNNDLIILRFSFHTNWPTHCFLLYLETLHLAITQFCDLPGFYHKIGFLTSHPLSLLRSILLIIVYHSIMKIKATNWIFKLFSFLNFIWWGSNRKQIFNCNKFIILRQWFFFTLFSFIKLLVFCSFIPIFKVHGNRKE